MKFLIVIVTEVTTIIIPLQKIVSNVPYFVKHVILMIFALNASKMLKFYKVKVYVNASKVLNNL